MSATLDPGQAAGSPSPAPPERSRGRRQRRDPGCGVRARDDEQPSIGVPAAATIRRRLLVALVLATVTVTLVLAVPPLRGTAHQIEAMNPIWVVAAVAFELGSCVGYVVIFRRFFPAGHGHRRLRRGQLRGCRLRAGLRRRPGAGGHRHGRLGRRLLLGRGGQHRLLGRPRRGPLRRLHDPAVPLRRLSVPGPAAGARLPGH